MVLMPNVVSRTLAVRSPTTAETLFSSCATRAFSL
jgi:hypothetical protein